MVLIGPCEFERSVMPFRAMVTSGPKLLLMAMSRSLVLLQLESMLKFIAVLPQVPMKTMC